MKVTATEFKNNFGKYLNVALHEEVEITKNGKVVGNFVSADLLKRDESRNGGELRNGDESRNGGESERNKLPLVRELPVTDIYDAGVGVGVEPIAHTFERRGPVTRSEAESAGRSDAAVSSGAVAAPTGIAFDEGEWLITRDGEPVAHLTPIPKKKKRKLGFFKGPEATPEEDAALFESEWTEEIEREWLNKP